MLSAIRNRERDSKFAGCFAGASTTKAVGNWPHSSEPFIETDRKLTQNRAHLDEELFPHLVARHFQIPRVERKIGSLTSTVRALNTVRPTFLREGTQRVVRIGEVDNRFSRCFRGVHDKLCHETRVCKVSIRAKKPCETEPIGLCAQR